MINLEDNLRQREVTEALELDSIEWFREEIGEEASSSDSPLSSFSEGTASEASTPGRDGETEQSPSGEGGRSEDRDSDTGSALEGGSTLIEVAFPLLLFIFGVFFFGCRHGGMSALNLLTRVPTQLFTARKTC